MSQNDPKWPKNAQDDPKNLIGMQVDLHHRLPVARTFGFIRTKGKPCYILEGAFTQIPLGQLEKGMYLLEVILDRKISARKKMVKTQ